MRHRALGHALADDKCPDQMTRKMMGSVRMLTPNHTPKPADRPPFSRPDTDTATHNRPRERRAVNTKLTLSKTYFFLPPMKARYDHSWLAGSSGRQSELAARGRLVARPGPGHVGSKFTPDAAYLNCRRFLPSPGLRKGREPGFMPAR